MNKRRFFYSLSMILLLIVAVAGWFATDYLGNKARQEIIGESKASTLTLSIYVSSTLNTITGAVKSLAGSPWIAPAVMSKRDQDIEHANSVLDRYNSAITASVSYLMDADGMTVASSNRQDPDSFVGKSLSFRPYFQQAVKGQAGRYFALGTIAKKRGFYATYPVQDRLGRVLGVVAMKKDLDEMETFFSKYPFCFLVSPDGIIFLSSTQAMVLKSLWPLDKTAQLKLIASQQFGNKVSEPVLKKEISDGTEVTLEGNDYFVSRKVIDSDGWSIALLIPTDRIRFYRWVSILATLSVGFLMMVFLGVIYVKDRSKEAIQQSEESRRLLLHAAGEGIFGVDVTGQLTFVNPSALRMLGFAEEGMLGQRVHALIHHSRKDGSNYPVEDCPTYASYTRATESRVLEEVFWRKDGSSIPVEYSSTPIIRDGKVTGAVVTFRDITERKQKEEELRASHEIIEGIINTIPARVFWKDKNLVYLGCNAAFARDAGFADPKDIIGKDDYQMGWRAQADLYRGDDRQIIESGCPKLLVEEPQTTPEGDTITLLTSKIPLRNSQGAISGVLGTYLEITERKRTEEKMEFLAAHDALTGLLNRRSLEEMLNRTIARAKRGTFSSLLFMDLDNFKNVNDTVGHAAGDEVLITLAGLFKDAVRTEDVAFRVGGDEFAFLLDGIFGGDALLVAERLRSAVEAHPFEQEGRVFPLGLSIGLIQIDGTLATGELMSQADGAMYRAKAQGKNRVAVA